MVGLAKALQVGGAVEKGGPATVGLYVVHHRCGPQYPQGRTHGAKGLAL